MRLGTPMAKKAERTAGGAEGGGGKGGGNSLCSGDAERAKEIGQEQRKGA